jgi:hypothetical protein
MKWKNVILTTALLMAPVIAQASSDDVCMVHEYAELKDMPKDKLLRTYKSYGVLAEIQNHGFDDMLKLATKMRGQGIISGIVYDSVKEDMTKYRLQGAQCGEQQERIGQILDNAGIPRNAEPEPGQKLAPSTPLTTLIK